MKETPIIMSGNHPKLILDGIKTQTRRVIKPQPPEGVECFGWFAPEIKENKAPEGLWFEDDDGLGFFCKCPYGQVGDRLWVREAFVIEEAEDSEEPKDRPFKYDMEWGLLIPHYRATEPEPNIVPDYVGDFDDKTRWSPSIFMPRWASRITLEITEVRVERLQEINSWDCIYEGIPQKEYLACDNMMRDKSNNQLIREYRDLWNSLNAKRGYGWEVNPWVWVIGFKVIK